MCATTQNPNKIIPDDNDRQGVCRCPAASYYSDLMLEAMQTSIIFFNNDGTIYRSNTLARKDLAYYRKPCESQSSQTVVHRQS